MMGNGHSAWYDETTGQYRHIWHRSDLNVNGGTTLTVESWSDERHYDDLMQEVYGEILLDRLSQSIIKVTLEPIVPRP